MKDQKIAAALAKPPLNLIPAASTIGPSRVFGYGAKKYAAGNYYCATLEDGAGGRYIAAALRHLSSMQEPNGLHTPDSLAALDAESALPHLDHAICGLMMLRSILVKCAALPEDPGEGNDPIAILKRQADERERLLIESRVRGGAFDVREWTGPEVR